MLEINGADRSIHGTQEEEQIWTAASTWKGMETQTQDSFFIQPVWAESLEVVLE